MLVDDCKQTLSLKLRLIIIASWLMVYVGGEDDALCELPCFLEHATFVIEFCNFLNLSLIFHFVKEMF